MSTWSWCIPTHLVSGSTHHITKSKRYYIHKCTCAYMMVHACILHCVSIGMMCMYTTWLLQMLLTDACSILGYPGYEDICWSGRWEGPNEPRNKSPSLLVTIEGVHPKPHRPHLRGYPGYPDDDRSRYRIAHTSACTICAVCSTPYSQYTRGWYVLYALHA